jgi:biotin carboxylase
MFERILIANRGEIAARLARTLRRLGADTVAVCVPGEETTVHVQACDTHVVLSSSAPDPYRDVAAIVRAAKDSGCQAVHAGYGLFDRGPELARAVERAGLVHVGPLPELVVLLRDRAALRTAAEEAGLRVLAASSRALAAPGEDEWAQALRDESGQLGFPLVIKPAYGVQEPATLTVIDDAEGLEGWINQRTKDDEGDAVVLERWVERPRHVEVYVVGDGTDVVAIGDVETSVRKDHRRVIAESPAPAIDCLHRGAAVRSAVWAASLDLARDLSLRGVAAVHFLFDASGHFHFVGMRPGLAPEHALLEMCTSVDLVVGLTGQLEEGVDAVNGVLLGIGEAVGQVVEDEKATGRQQGVGVERVLQHQVGLMGAIDVDEVEEPAGQLREHVLRAALALLHLLAMAAAGDVGVEQLLQLQAHGAQEAVFAAAFPGVHAGDAAAALGDHLIQQPEGGAALPGAHLQDADRPLLDGVGEPALPHGDMACEIVVGEHISLGFAGGPAAETVTAAKSSGRGAELALAGQVVAEAVVGPEVVHARLHIGLQAGNGVLGTPQLGQRITKHGGNGRFEIGCPQRLKRRVSSDIRFWPSGDTKTGPPGGLLMGPFWGPLDLCFIGVCRVGVVGGGILCRPYGDSPQASSLDGGGRRPLPSSEEEPPVCGRIRPLRRFSLSR